MAQMVQQIACQQAVPAQTGPKASNPDKDTNTFQSLIHSAAESVGKSKGKPETGGKTGKPEDSGKGETGPDSMQPSLAAVLLPFLSDGQFPHTPLLSVSDAGLSPAVQSEQGVLQEAAPADSPPLTTGSQGPSAVSPSLQEDASASNGIQPSSETAKAELPATGDVPQTVPTVPKQESSAEPVLSAQAPSGGDKAPVQPDPAESAADNFAAEPTVPQKTPQSEAAVQTDRTDTKAVGSNPQAEKTEVRSSDDAQPIRKTENRENGTGTRSLSDLYAGGNVVIKISDAKAAQKPTAAGQVAQAVAQQLKQGKQEFQVELYPQSLGKVSVKLSAENGILTVEIAAANPKTQSLLLSGSEDIRSMLQASTGQNVNVVKPEQSGWYDQQNDGGSGYRQQEQEEERQKESETARSIRSIGAESMNTGSFLSILQLAQ